MFFERIHTNSKSRNMKNKIILIPILILAIFISGCDEYLDQPIKGSQTFESFYSNQQECNQAVLGCYQSLSPEDWWEMDYFWLIGDVCSDDAFKGNSIEGDQQEFGNMARWIIDANNEWLDIKWRYSYITISRANLIIEYVPEAPIDQVLIDQYVAEAKFLRGWAYFELVKNFGGAVLVDKQPAPSDVFPRSSEAETWAFIEKDFRDAASALPEREDQASEEMGRATKGAALGCLARAFLYQGKFGEAQAFAEQVMGLNDYELEGDFGNVWSVNNPNGVESIFEIQNNYDPLQWTGNALPVITRSRADGGWGFGTPSSHLENFMQGDPRLPHIIIKHGDFVDADHPSYDTQLDQNESGRTNRKFYLGFSERVPDDEYIKAPLNHILLRYADLLLIHAEAAYHNSQEGPALASLNEVRARVDLEPLSVSGQALLDAVFAERRMELAMEGHRYYDLKRSGRLEAAMADFVNYNMNESTDPYDAGNQQGVLFDGSKHSLFPIPQAEIDVSGGVIVQNPNY